MNKKKIYSYGEHVSNGIELDVEWETLEEFREYLSSMEGRFLEKGFPHVNLEEEITYSDRCTYIYGWRWETERECIDRVEKEELSNKNKKQTKIAKLEEQLAKLKQECGEYYG